MARLLGPRRRAQRVLNPHPRRHYRRSYNVAELPYGIAVILALCGIAWWVRWMGSNPDPELFANTSDLLDPGLPQVDRGPLPQNLAAAGWREGALSSFGSDDLYKKINGRADYFKSRGFVRLLFVSLHSESDDTLTLDIECYDMGKTENALGTYASEKAPEIESRREGGGLWHIERNALFLAKGQYYIRAIASAENEPVQTQFVHLREVLQAALDDAALPWAHTLFSERIGIPVGRITFHRENAFSFAFAKHVYAALPDDDQAELFVVAATDEPSAATLAARFVEGFLEYGSRAEIGAVPWVKDQYLGNLSVAQHAGALVYGVRGAATDEAARAGLQKLKTAVLQLPDGLLARAQQDLRKEEEAARPYDE